MFDVIGHSVVKLRRARIGSIRDDDLKPGYWRLLRPVEVSRLMKVEGKSKPARGSRERPAGHGSARR